MPKLWIAALTAIAAGLLVGGSTARWEPQSCWRPGLARNIGIAEQGCD